MAENNFVKWEKFGDTGVLYLDHPPENYIVQPGFIPISQLSEWLSDDVKALIITGTGRHFSAGADLKALINQAGNKEDLFDEMIAGNRLLEFISGLDIPVVAAISGICFGGGLEIALAADLRFCTERSLFAFPEVNHDLIPGLGGLKRLEKICGHKTALEILISGDTINAKKALEIKLADVVINDNEILDYSLKYTNGLVSGRSPLVIRMLMRSFRNAAMEDRDKVMEDDVRMFCELAVEYSKRQNQ